MGNLKKLLDLTNWYTLYLSMKFHVFNKYICTYNCLLGNRDYYYYYPVLFTSILCSIYRNILLFALLPIIVFPSVHSNKIIMSASLLIVTNLAVALNYIQIKFTQTRSDSKHKITREHENSKLFLMSTRIEFGAWQIHYSMSQVLVCAVCICFTPSKISPRHNECETDI